MEYHSVKIGGKILKEFFKDVENNEKVRNYIRRHTLILGALGKLHGYLEHAIKMYDLVVTEKMAKDVIDENDKEVERMLIAEKTINHENKTNIYRITKKMVKKEQRVDGLAVVGLIRNQEEYIKKQLIYYPHCSFFFPEELNNNYAYASFIELFNYIVEKFNLNEEFCSVIIECNEFSNSVKHSYPDYYDGLMIKMKKRTKKNLFFNAGDYKNAKKVFIWIDLLADYIKSLELFWLHVFVNLEKMPKSKCKLCYYHNDKKMEMEIHASIVDLCLEIQKVIKEFWLDKQEKYGIHFNEKCYKKYFFAIEELCNDEKP